jgi:hypothetical protein
MFCITFLYALQTHGIIKGYEPIKKPSLSDTQQIISILEDIKQGILQGDIEKIKQYLPVSIESNKIGSALKVSMNQSSSRGKKRPFNLKRDTIEIKTNGDVAIAKCLMTDSESSKEKMITIRFYKSQSGWLLDTNAVFFNKLDKYVKKYGALPSTSAEQLLKSPVKLLKSTASVSSIKSLATQSLNSTTTTNNSYVSIVESDRMLIPWPITTVPFKWSINESDAVSYANSELFSSIKDAEVVKILDANYQYVDRVYFALDPDRKRIIYGSENGYWIKSYGDWSGDYEFKKPGGMRVIQFPDRSIRIFVAETETGEIANFLYDKTQGKIVYSNSFKSPLLSPVDVDVDLRDVYRNNSTYAIWVADKALQAIVCLNPNGTENFRIDHYTYQGVSYPTKNITKIMSQRGDLLRVAFIDADRNAFVTMTFLDLRTPSYCTVFSFAPPSRLVDFNFLSDNYYVVDQNLNQIHLIRYLTAGRDQYVGSFSKYDSHAAENISIFTGITGVPFDRPQAMEVYSYMESSTSLARFLDFGVVNQWGTSSGFVKFVPGADILSCQASYYYGEEDTYLKLEYTLPTYSLRKLRVYNQNNVCVYEESDANYMGKMVSCIPFSTLGQGTFTLEVSAISAYNDNYNTEDGNFRQKPAELFCSFSTADESIITMDPSDLPTGTTLAFSPVQNISISDDPRAITTADFNKDGKQDIAVAEGTGNISIYQNTTTLGSATSFAAPLVMQSGLGQYSLPQSIATGDLNGDGKQDIVVANLNGTVSFFMNTTPTNGNLSFSKINFTTLGGMPRSVAVGDLDGDGLPDIVVTDNMTLTVGVYLNQTTTGAATPSFSQKYEFGQIPPVFIPQDDEEANGYPGRYINWQSWRLAIGDINCDGKLDIVVAYSGGEENYDIDPIYVLMNTGSQVGVPSFSLVHILNCYPGSHTPRSIAVGDVNGDGKPDLATADDYGGKVRIFLNTTISGSQDIAFSIPYNLNQNDSYGITIADINDDGRNDVVYGGYWSGYKLSILLSAPPTFTSGTIVSNALWQGNIILTGNLTISNGATLTINPGTAIYLLAGNKITVSAGSKINANGASGSPIQFVRATSDSAWDRILLNGDGNQFSWCLFNGGTYNVDVRSNNNTFTNCTFQNAQRGVSAGEIQGSTAISLALSSCGVKNNGTGIAIYGYNTNATMDHVTIQNNSGIGVYHDGYAHINSFTNNLIANNGSYGVYMQEGSGVFYMGANGNAYNSNYNVNAIATAGAGRNFIRSNNNNSYQIYNDNNNGGGIVMGLLQNGPNLVAGYNRIWA